MRPDKIRLGTVFSEYYHISLLPPRRVSLKTPLDDATHRLLYTRLAIAFLLLTQTLSCFSSQVSWVRHRDIHLLTVGRYTYTGDQRFRSINQPPSEDWTLQIKYPQIRDSGIYECQISTTPHISQYIHLQVVGKWPTTAQSRDTTTFIIS